MSHRPPSPRSHTFPAPVHLPQLNRRVCRDYDSDGGAAAAAAGGGSSVNLGFGKRTTAQEVADAVPGSLKGKTIIITGANSGVGFDSALACAQRGAAVIMGCRSLERGNAAAEEIKAQLSGADSGSLTVMQLDVSSMASVRQFAAAFIATGAPCHVLLNNAGIGNYSGGGSGPKTTEVEGWELIFATDYIGPYLLTHLLLPSLRSSAPSRVVNVSSEAGEMSHDFNVNEMPYTAEGPFFARYGQAKMAQTLHAAELTKREAANGVTAYSLHPGVIRTNIWQEDENLLLCCVGKLCLPCCGLCGQTKTQEQGAATQVMCAVSPGIEADAGKFFDDCVARPHKRAEEVAQKQAELFDATNVWLQL